MEFNFRKLTAADIAPMCKIINKIGIKEFGRSLDMKDIKNVLSKKNKDNEEETERAIGFRIFLEFTDVILANISKCENDIFKLLADISGMNFNDVKNLPLADFAEMIVALVQKDDFKDFISVVSKLMK